MKYRDFENLKVGQKYSNTKTTRTITEIIPDSHISCTIIKWVDGEGKPGECYADTFLRWVKERTNG